MTVLAKGRDKGRPMGTLHQQAAFFPPQGAKKNVLRVRAPPTQFPEDLIIARRGENIPESLHINLEWNSSAKRPKQMTGHYTPINGRMLQWGILEQVPEDAKSVQGSRPEFRYTTDS